MPFLRVSRKCAGAGEGQTDMHILQVARRFAKNDWGGTETVMLETSRRLLAMGHYTEVFCTTATADRDREVIDGVHVRRYPYFYPYFGLKEEAKRVLDKKGGSPFSFALLKALKQFPDLDLIHLHAGNRIGGIGRYVAMKRQVPYVISLHGGVFDVPPEEAETWTAPAKGAIEWGKALGWWVGSRRVLTDAAAILCVGYQEKVMTQRRLPEKRVIHLPNGVDPERFANGDGQGFRERYGIPQDAYVMLTVARIDSQKNQLLPVRMLPELLKVHPRTHVLLIGNVTNAAYHARVTLAVREARIEDHVTIIPGLDAGSRDLVDAYHAADVFLLPSIHEPFGIVILEAWAAGLPVLASRVGGIPHFVSDGEDGLLFESDDPKTFLDAFRALTQDPHRARALARAGQRKACEHFTWDAVTRKLAAIYEEVVHEYPVRK